jgi:hypothetical protein
MQLPPNFLSANVLACERVLEETDTVYTLVRVFDAIAFNPPPGIDTAQSVIPMWVLAIAKCSPGYTGKHEVLLNLIRPDGEITPLGDPSEVEAGSKIPDAAGGFAVKAQIGLLTKQTGVHYFSLMLDGQEIARFAFTLLPHLRKQ